MEQDKVTIQDFINRNVTLDLKDGVRLEVLPDFDNPKQYIIALYDRTNPKKAIQGSWVCNEKEALRKLGDIQRRYGKEVG